MQPYSLKDAQTQLDDLVEAALHGETVLIQRDDEQIVQLVPVPIGKKPRKAGSARNQIVMAEDFDAPLPDFGEYME